MNTTFFDSVFAALCGAAILAGLILIAQGFGLDEDDAIDVALMGAGAVSLGHILLCGEENTGE